MKESKLRSPGIAETAGPFMTWTANAVPKIGSIAGTWQGYAAAMFSTLLQNLVNAIEEIIHTIEQLTKSLSSIAKSIAQSHQWWRILLSVLLPIVLVAITVLVNIFAPGLFAVILSTLVNGIRFIGSAFTLGGEATGDLSLEAVTLVLRGGGGSEFDPGSELGSLSSVDMSFSAEESISPDLSSSSDELPDSSWQGLWANLSHWSRPLDGPWATVPGYELEPLPSVFAETASEELPASSIDVQGSTLDETGSIISESVVESLFSETSNGTSILSTEVPTLSPEEAAQLALDQQTALIRNNFAALVDSQINDLITFADSFNNLHFINQLRFIQDLVSRINDLSDLPPVAGFRGWSISEYASTLANTLTRNVLVRFLGRLNLKALGDFVDGLTIDEIRATAPVIVDALSPDAVGWLFATFPHELAAEARAAFLGGLTPTRVAQLRPLLNLWVEMANSGLVP